MENLNCQCCDYCGQLLVLYLVVEERSQCGAKSSTWRSNKFEPRYYNKAPRVGQSSYSSNMFQAMI